MNDNIERLKELAAVLRSDLHVSRQKYRDEAVYVIHDPVSFQTHRINVLQYTLAASLDGRRKLQDVFRGLVHCGKLAEKDEQFFYDLVINLYKAGMVVLPIHSGTRLFEQFERIQSLKRKRRLTSLLFLRLPLSNPDLFLRRTSRYVNWLFCRWFMIAWLAAGLLAVAVLTVRFRDFTEPLNGLLSPGNLPILWVIFIALKLWHELGHGYACNRFGGRVPEMGTILIVGNPLAYVDATAAWSFPERWKRLVVMCGGMYFETLVAIPAVFVWAIAGHGVVASCAYQVIITASIVTLLFNANPLMKFDGYFILSELIRIPNLRSRADAQVKRVLKRAFLWISTGPEETPGNSAVLIGYGFASMAYRVFLVLSIAWVIASRFPLVGIAIAVFYAGSSLLSTVSKVGKYLLSDDQTSRIRIRARVVAFLLFIVAPSALTLLPVPFDVVAWGVVRAEKEHYVRVRTPGEFQTAKVTPGQAVERGQPLMRLSNVVAQEEAHLASVRLHEAMLKWQVARENDVVESARLEAEIQILQHQLLEARRREQELQVVAPESGRVLRVHDAAKRGAYLRVGEAVAIVVDGQPVLQVWLTQHQLNDIVRSPHTLVRFRISGRADQTFFGRLTNIRPAAEAMLTEQALTNVGGGDLAVDPETYRPLEALFQVEIAPHRNTVTLDSHGSRVAVAIPREYETISSWTFRKCLRLLQQLLLA